MRLRCLGRRVCFPYPPHRSVYAGAVNEIAPPLADGRYRLLSVLGHGGMAIVYRAFDERLQATRAIKVLLPKLVEHEKVRTRFENEARTLARLTHNNLVTVHDVGVDGDRVYFVMEWLPGGSLRDRVNQDGPLPLGVAAGLIDATLAGLGYAHEQGVVHRDIKPQNILLTADGDVRVADFGIARTSTGDEATRHGAVMGTWAYMAPEQRNSATHAAPASDLYAVTATFYYLLTARDPVDLHASDSHEALFKGIHPAVSAFLAQGTRYKPEARFADAAAMRTALRALLERADSALSLAAPEETASPPEGSDTFGISSLDAEETATGQHNAPEADVDAREQGEAEPAPAANVEPESSPPATAVPADTHKAVDASPTPARSGWPLGLGAAGLAAVALAAFGMLSGPASTASTRWYLDLMPTANGLVPIGQTQRPSAPGQSLWRVTYDPKGRPETFVRVNGADYPWARNMDNDRYVAGLRNVWEGDIVRGIDVLNEAGSTVHTLDFQRTGDVLTVRHTHLEGATAEADCDEGDQFVQVRGHYTLDSRYPDFPCGEQLPVSRYTVDAQGRLTEGYWFDAAETPTRGPDGAWGARYTWTEDGRIVRRTALDAKGNEILGWHGIVSAVWTYPEDQWLPSGVHFEAFAGVPASTPNRISRIRWAYDAQGRRTDWTYEDNRGEPVRHLHDICLAWRYSWTDTTKVTHCLDAAGAPLLHPRGWHVFETTLDARHYPTRLVYQNAQGKPVDTIDDRTSHIQVSYDELGRQVQKGPHLNTNGEPVTIFRTTPRAVTAQYGYDSRGNQVVARYLEADGALISDGTCAIWRTDFDGLREVRLRFYDGQSNPVVGPAGFAGITTTWTARGLEESRTALDVNDQPLTSVGTLTSARYRYDELGRLTSEEFFDGAGNRVLDSHGCAILRTTREGNRTESSCLDTAGVLTNPTEGGARWTMHHNSLGLDIEYRSYDADGEPIRDAETGEVGIQWTYDRMGRVSEERRLGDTLTVPCVRLTYEYDNRNLRTRLRCADEDGAPASFRPGVSYVEEQRDYDAYDRQTETRFLGADGERVVNEHGCWARVLTYEDDEQQATCVPPPHNE